MTMTTSHLSRRSAWFDKALWRATPGPFRVSAIILVAHVLFAIADAFWTRYGFAEMGAGLPLSGASLQHPMGLDQIGRDVFSRFMYGAHIVLLLSFAGTMLGMVAGTTLGLLFTQRIVEAMISIPFLALALVMIIAAGPALEALRHPRRRKDA